MIYVRNTPAIVEAVRLQQFDLGIVGRAPPYRGVELLHETSVAYVCLLPNAHPLAARRGRLDLETLADSETFITFGGVYPDEMIDLDRDLSARLRQRSRLSAANTSVMASLVRETGALALVDPFTAAVAEQIGGVTSRPLVQHLRYRLAVITKGGDTLSREARELADGFIDRLKRAVAPSVS